MKKKRGSHFYVLFFAYFFIVAFLAFFQYYGNFNIGEVAGVSTKKANKDVKSTSYNNNEKKVLASYSTTSLKTSPSLVKTDRLNQLFTAVIVSFIGFFVIIALFSYRFFRKNNIHNYK